MTVPNRDNDVIVIGGGFAGACLVHNLALIGRRAIVVEKAEYCGGLLSQVQLGTGVSELAPHFFFHSESRDHVRQFVRAMSPTVDIQPRAVTCPTGALEEAHDYPLTKRNLDRWPDAPLLHQEFVKAQSAPRHGAAQTLEEYLCRLVGVTVYERYYKTYSTKMWGLAPHQLTARWAPGKIRFSARPEAFLKEGRVYRPAIGYGPLVARLLGNAPVVHGEASSLRLDGDHVVGVELSDGQIIRGSQYVVTCPISRLLKAVPQLSVRSMVFVYLVLETNIQTLPASAHWAYFPNHYRFTRITDMTACGHVVDMSPEHRVYCYEFPCSVGDDTWCEEDASLVRECLKPLLNPEVSLTRVIRVGDAYPIPTAQNDEVMRYCTSLVAGIGNLHRLGRFGEFDYIWLADIVEHASAVAACIGARTN